MVRPSSGTDQGLSIPLQQATSPRRILHCDMDCFYAAVHMRDDPALRGKPVVIGGTPESRGVVAAASYEARAFGIRSAMPSSQARRRCAHAIFLKPEFARYREESGFIFEVFREFTPVVQGVSVDEAYLDVTEHLGTWGSATAVAVAIKDRVRERTGLTVSVGVGPNRLVAKIASDFDKPDGLTVVPPKRVDEFLAPLHVRNLQGVGPATEKRLLEAFAVRTIADLRRVRESSLVSRLGRYGSQLFDFARGIDERPVVDESVRKSYSSERTYSEDLKDPQRIENEIVEQAERVGAGMAKRELVGSTVTLKVRYENFETVTRSLTLKEPTNDPDRLAQTALLLLGRTQARVRPVRLLGVGVSKLTVAGAREPMQLDLLLPVPSSSVVDG